jgi:hypothetical protein
MSIVPKEVVEQWYDDWRWEDEYTGLPDYIADKAAQWAFEQAMQKCQSVVDQYSDEYGVDGACAAAGCYAAIRVMMKGGESDGQG